MNTKSIRNDWKLIESLIQENAKVLDIGCGEGGLINQLELNIMADTRGIEIDPKLARKANLDALVCSAHEIKYVKKIFKKEIITPGIRFNKNLNDQKRVMTPKQAFKNGSDWLVIGRPITKGNIRSNLKNLINHLKQ